MTGYGLSEKDGCKIEIKTVNHRFLDLNIKLPQALMKYEIHLRKVIKESLARGRVDVVVTALPEKGYSIDINRPLTDNLINTLRQLANDYNIAKNIELNDLMTFKDIVLIEPKEIDNEALLETLTEALNNVKTARQQEGASLLEKINEHLNSIENITEIIKEKSQLHTQNIMEKLTKKLQEILNIQPYSQIDKDRLLQETAFLAERADITEELNRMFSHLIQFRQDISENDKIGRKLEFIIQEMNREVNTLSSKSQEYEINKLAVELKNVIEQLREQVQNIQ
ncbi:hypothetical protein MCHI_003666 [Candidatus Magnetoovum chiemensis]|nr:hypothetical protein MCHI_003666 [Candidatus Magnetoovum chiemensis]